MDVICFNMYYAFFHLSWFDNYSFLSWYGICFMLNFLKMNSYILTNQDLLSIDMDSHSVHLICGCLIPDCFDFKISEKLLLCCLYMNSILGCQIFKFRCFLKTFGWLKTCSTGCFFSNFFVIFLQPSPQFWFFEPENCIFLIKTKLSI